MLSNRSRRRTGNFICELPLVVWVLILCFFLPLFDLASIAMHVCSVNAAARDAARVAGRAASYSQATAAAANQARLTIATGPAGVRLLSVATVVVATPLNGGTPTRFRGPVVAHPELFIYQLEVSVRARLSPMVPLSSAIFGNIPGLSAPTEIQAYGREFCEHPSGLAQ
jgi:Flp pilus assembly protein TadG